MYYFHNTKFPLLVTFFLLNHKDQASCTIILLGLVQFCNLSRKNLNEKLHFITLEILQRENIYLDTARLLSKTREILSII